MNACIYDQNILSNYLEYAAAGKLTSQTFGKTSASMASEAAEAGLIPPMTWLTMSRERNLLALNCGFVFGAKIHIRMILRDFVKIQFLDKNMTFETV